MSGLPPMVGILGVPSRILARRIALVVLGGALGSVARYLIGLWTAQQFGAGFPWGTFLVNVCGSFLIGLLATFADEAKIIGPDTRVLLVVGVLGGFTTFSSFALDTMRLGEQGALFRPTVYVLASVGLSFLAAIAGIALARALHR